MGVLARSCKGFLQLGRGQAIFSWARGELGSFQAQIWRPEVENGLAGGLEKISSIPGTR